MNSSFDAAGTQFAWDSTSLTLWLECPRKYFYSMVENWRPIQTSVHLFFGGVFASSLEYFHKQRAAGVAYDDAQADMIHHALRETFADGAPIPLDHPAKTRENLIRTLVWYTEQFRDDNLKTYITDEGKPAVEFSFALPTETDVFLTGHIDRLVTYGDDIYVTDNKTTGSTITSQFFKQFDTSGQMTQYTFAGKVIYSLPIKGVIIDGAQIAVGFSRFERGFTHRSTAQLEEWYEETLETIERARDATIRRKFPKNHTSCDKYGGCPFRDVCTADPKVRTNFLKAKFTQDAAPWDPLKQR